MRVLTPIHSFEPGGVERMALRLVRAWREAGVDAPLWVGRRRGSLEAELGRDLAFDTPPSAPGPVGLVETLWMIALLPGAIRRSRPDVLFCAGNSYAVIGVAMKLLLGRRCPAVVLKVSNDLHRRDLPAPLRIAYRCWLRIQRLYVDRWIAIADGLEAEILEVAGADPARVEVIPNPSLSAADLAVRPVGAPDRDLHGTEIGRRFVAIGRLARQKNVPAMIAAFAAGARARDVLTIYGDGPERRRIVRWIERLRLGDRVRLVGHAPRAASRLGGHDVLLLSSDYEGLPGAVVEALAAGLPVVATDCSRAMAALLDGGRLGRLVPTGNAGALAAAIRDIRPDALADERRRHVAAHVIETGAARFVRSFARAADARAAVLALSPPFLAEPIIQDSLT